MGETEPELEDVKLAPREKVLVTEAQGEVVGVALWVALTLWEPVALADVELR